MLNDALEAGRVAGVQGPGRVSHLRKVLTCSKKTDGRHVLGRYKLKHVLVRIHSCLLGASDAQ